MAGIGSPLNNTCGSISGDSTMKITDVMKAIVIAIRARGAWLHAYDFNDNFGIFIGHRGCARISDAKEKYPELIKWKPDPQKPKQHIYRFRTENTADALAGLPPDMRQFVEEELINAGTPFQKRVKRMVIDEATHTARMETAIEMFNEIPEKEPAKVLVESRVVPKGIAQSSLFQI